MSRRSPAPRVTAAATVRRQASRPSSRFRRSSSSSGPSTQEPVRRGSPDPSGIVLVDKPAGPSSFAVVRDLRDRTGARAGHAGTLDPFATGLLLVLLGRSTKLAQRFVGLDKRYLTEIDLTARTSTGDPEGELIDGQTPPTPKELERRLEAMQGEIELPIPPPRR